MNREDISNALNGIDEKYIEEAAEDLPAHRRVWSWRKGLIPLAACLAVVLSVGLYRSYLYQGMKVECGSNMEPQTEESDAPSDCVTAEKEGSTIVVKVQGELTEGFTGDIVETECEDRWPVGTQVQVYFTDDCEDMTSQESIKGDSTEYLVKVRFSASETQSEGVVLYAEDIEVLN